MYVAAFACNLCRIRDEIATLGDFHEQIGLAALVKGFYRRIFGKSAYLVYEHKRRATPFFLSVDVRRGIQEREIIVNVAIS